MVEVCWGDSQMVRASVWKPRCDGSNPRQNQTESKIQNLLQEVSWDGCPLALHEGFSILPILVR